MHAKEWVDYDVVVVGAGVIGSATAYALAKAGKRCLLLEAAPDAIRRYAGEWMHPTVPALMKGLGLEAPKEAVANDAGDGFMVHPGDGSAAIELRYPDGERGFCCSHYDLSASVRAQAVAHPNVEYVPYARVIDVQRDGRVRYHVSDALADREVTAALVVGAEGRSSVCRRVLQPDRNRDVVSYMAALTLEGDVELPTEGFGHILMGGPGVALAYRVSADEVRLSLDVPASAADLRRDPEKLMEAFRPALPAALREGMERAFERKAVRWTATFFQPRTERGADRIVLVGDAIGLCHPLCAAGVAVGLLDVTLLAQAVRDGDIAGYRRSGARETWVPELMSCAVYQLLGGPEVSAQVRKAMFQLWRDDAQARDETLRILMGAERRPAAFVKTFARVGWRSVSALLEAPSMRRLRAVRPGAVTERAKRLGGWLRWPVASVLPAAVVNRIRPDSTISAPF